jgi:hypothetical protein
MLIEPWHAGCYNNQRVVGPSQVILLPARVVIEMTTTSYPASANALTGQLLSPRNAEWRKATSGQLRLQKQLNAILKSIKDRHLRDAFRRALTDLSRLHDMLRLVEINVSEGGPVSLTLAIFSLVESEARALLRFIEKDTSTVKSIKGPLRSVLNGTSFTLRHELKRVYGQDLAQLSPAPQPNQVRSDIMRAHGLLSNCFQQSILTLCQVLDPSVTAPLLFEDYRERIESSILLIKDLSLLMQLARLAQELQDAEASLRLIRELDGFCQGAIYHLMYKDWDEFTDIAKEVTASYGSARHGFIVHCFVMYLEALINQVQMRAVLNDQASGLSGSKSVKSARTKRRGCL